MKKIVLLLIGIVGLSAFSFAQSVSDPNVQVRDAKDFHAIHISSAFDVLLTQSDEEKVAVSAAQAKDLQYIKVEVSNGVLKIGWDQKGMWMKGNKKLKAYISFKMINKLQISGACNVSIVGTLKADELNVNLSGASDLKGKLEVANGLSLDLSGASDMKVTGSASKMNIEASGASSFKGWDFATDYCTAKATGASDIKMTVNKELSAHASGASDIGYKGDGVIRDIKTSGASSISHRS